jgi:bifunctional non-homologous end joining protein LigD
MKTLKAVSLSFREGSSDKLYNAALVQEDDGTHTVHVEWGRRGLTLQQGTKAERTSLEVATKAFDKVVKEKTGKNYKEVPGADGKTTLVGAEKTGGREKLDGPTAQLLNPVEEDEAERLILNEKWVAQRKYDGVRIRAHLDPHEIRFTNRKGQITSVMKEIEESLTECGPRPMLLDGEIAPTEKGSAYWVFDLLAIHGDDNISRSGYTKRHKTLVDLAATLGPSVKVAPVYVTTSEKRELVDRLKAERAEGVVFKLASAPYTPGRPASGGSQLKLKFTKTADVIITKWDGKAFRMAVYDGGKPREIGKVYTGTTEDDRADLKAEIKKGQVVAEVRYLYATDGDVLFQPVFVRRRTDKNSEECLLSQLVRTNRSTDEDETSRGGKP